MEHEKRNAAITFLGNHTDWERLRDRASDSQVSWTTPDKRIIRG